MKKRAKSYKYVVAIAALAAGLAAGVTGASALVVLSDNFNADPAGPNKLTGAGDGVFAVTSGNVDVVGTTPSPGFFSSLAFQGNSVDLNGSTTGGVAAAPGTLTSDATLAAGNYTLTFELSGNQRGDGSKTTNVLVGSTQIGQYILSSSTPYTLETINFTTTGGKLSFQDLAGGENAAIGNLLDDVTVSTTGVPEPSTWAMMLLGFMALGFAGYSKTAQRLPASSRT